MRLLLPRTAVGASPQVESLKMAIPGGILTNQCVPGVAAAAAANLSNKDLDVLSRLALKLNRALPTNQPTGGILWASGHSVYYKYVDSD